MDYKNGKIYRLVCNKTGLQYIGSTTQRLSKRLYLHKNGFKRWKEGKCETHVRSFDIIENDDYQIVLIELFPCETKEELLKRERYWIETLDCINVRIPKQSLEERREYERIYREENADHYKEWREENRERLKIYDKERYVVRRDKLLEKWSQEFNCQCGSVIRYGEKSRHFKTKKHQRWLESQTNKQEP
jgi:hypothetical protein